jgi:nitrite reductase/ring-hydroxylating ferredoxin subunit
MNRRDLLQYLAYGSLGGLLGTLSAWEHAHTAEEPLPIFVEPQALEREPSLLILAQADVAIVKEPAGIAFVSLRCTHLGCRLECQGREFICPCHGGRFSLQGTVLAGPPGQDLPWFEGGMGRSGQLFFYPERRNRKRRLIPIED